MKRISKFLVFIVLLFWVILIPYKENSDFSPLSMADWGINDYKKEPVIDTCYSMHTGISWLDPSGMKIQKLNISTGNLDFESSGESVIEIGSAQFREVQIVALYDSYILVWRDDRIADDDENLYAQRISLKGEFLWGVGGVEICTAQGNQKKPRIVSCNEGVIIVWEDYRNDSQGDIYAQYINWTGDIQWQPNGIVISNETGAQKSPQISSFYTGMGGSGPDETHIVTWHGISRSQQGAMDIYAHKLLMDGSLLWDDNGSVVCSAPGDQLNPQIAFYCYLIHPDYYHGAFIVWEDKRNYAETKTDLYVQNVDLDGNFLWDDNGTVVCAEIEDQICPMISDIHHRVYDVYHVCLVAWIDERSNNRRVAAQIFDHEGNDKWHPEWHGIPVSNPYAGATVSNNFNLIVDSGNLEIIITYEEKIIGSYWDIVMQKLTWDGEILLHDPYYICKTDYDKYNHHTVLASTSPVDKSSINVVWESEIYYEPCFDYVYDIYLQQIYANNTKRFSSSGLVVAACDRTCDPGDPLPDPPPPSPPLPEPNPAPDVNWWDIIPGYPLIYVFGSIFIILIILGWKVRRKTV